MPLVARLGIILGVTGLLIPPGSSALREMTEFHTENVKASE